MLKFQLSGCVILPTSSNCVVIGQNCDSALLLVRRDISANHTTKREKFKSPRLSPSFAVFQRLFGLSRRVRFVSCRERKKCFKNYLTCTFRPTNWNKLSKKEVRNALLQNKAFRRAESVNLEAKLDRYAIQYHQSIFQQFFLKNIEYE
jgi:hypothetical protein